MNQNMLSCQRGLVGILPESVENFSKGEKQNTMSRIIVNIQDYRLLVRRIKQLLRKQKIKNTLFIHL